MIALELIQRQRQILHTLHNIVNQYYQQIAKAQEDLEHALERIQANKFAAEQEAKQTCEQAIDIYITAVLDIELPVDRVREEDIIKTEQMRAELRSHLLSNTHIEDWSVLNSEVAYGSDSVPLIEEKLQMIKEKLQEISRSGQGLVAVPRRTNIELPVLLLSSIPGIGIAILVIPFLRDLSSYITGVCCLGVIFLILCFAVDIAWRFVIRERAMTILKKRSQELSYLSYAYQNWLELIAQSSEIQSLEAQQARQQAFERAKSQFLNSVQQLSPATLDYTTLADRISPPWQDEVWKNWKPGMLATGVVRLGVFTLSPDQLVAKSATV